MSTVSREVLGHPITATARWAGADVVVTVLGGCAPHVGSVSMARWIDGEVEVTSLVGEGHKDQLVGEAFARALARKTGATVSVTCGIHYESPGRDGLAAIVACAEGLCKDLVNAL